MNPTHHLLRNPNYLQEQTSNTIIAGDMHPLISRTFKTNILESISVSARTTPVFIIPHIIKVPKIVVKLDTIFQLHRGPVAFEGKENLAASEDLPASPTVHFGFLAWLEYHLRWLG
jgi:hypothetical protein